MISLIVSDRPSAAATAVFWLTAIETATAPAVALIQESSVAMTTIARAAAGAGRQVAAVADPGPGVVADPVVADRAGQADRECGAAARSGDAAGGTDAEGEDAGEHLGVDADGPPDVTSESSISAQTRLPSPSPSMMLTANDPPMATAAAVPLPAEANEIATAPAPAMICESFLA